MDENDLVNANFSKIDQWIKKFHIRNHGNELKKITMFRLLLSKFSPNQSLLTGCGNLKMGKQKCWALGICVYINISSVVEFQRGWVLKIKLFGQESTCHQGKIFKKFLRVMTVHQKVPKSYFQSQFWMSKINRIFSKKKKLSKNINLGDHILWKTFFSRLFP